jgi:hypothetical protein
MDRSIEETQPTQNKVKPVFVTNTIKCFGWQNYSICKKSEELSLALHFDFVQSSSG